MDPGNVSQGVQGCPSPGMAERGEGNGGCNRGDGLPPGTGNGGCNRSDGLPPVPRTPSQQGSGSEMDGQTPETSNMPQQQPQQQQANVSQNVSLTCSPAARSCWRSDYKGWDSFGTFLRDLISLNTGTFSSMR